MSEAGSTVARFSSARLGSSPHDLRLVPVAAAAWAGAWVGTGLAGADRWSSTAVGGVVATALALVLLARLRRAVLAGAVAACLVAATVVGALAAHRLAGGPVADLADDQSTVDVVGVVSGDPLLRAGQFGGYATVRVRVRVIEGRGQAWAVHSPLLVVASGDEAATGWARVLVGSTVRIVGRLEAVDRGSDVSAVLRVRQSPEVRAPPGTSLLLVERVRQGLRDAVRDRPPEPRALVPALVLGDTSAMTPELTDSFATTGLTHLTAVSGANLTLLLAFLLFGAKWLGVRGRLLRVVGLGGVVLFVALCRTEPSVLRAAAMGLVALAALGTGGGRRGLRHLAVAVVLLVLADPFLARSLGFTLSVLASAGIVWWASAWVAATIWLPRIVAEALMVPLAAHLATLPVVAAISDAVSVSGLLANALAGLFVGPATVLGFAAAGLSLLSSWLAGIVGWGASWCAQVIIWIAHAGAALPGSSWAWPAGPLPLVVLGVLALGFGLSVKLLLRRRWLAVGAGVVLVTAMLTGPVQPGWPPTGWRMVVCDVGQGDGLVIRAGPGQAVVVDVGPDPSAMRRCLTTLRVKAVPVLVLSHFHADHVDGLSAVLGRLPVGQVLVSPYASPSVEVAMVRALARSSGATVRSPPLGERARVGEVWWQVLGPVGSPTGRAAELGESAQSGAENDASLVLRVDVGGLALLLTGDVEPEGQARILATGADVRADVLKVPHHGSRRQDPAFFAATGARIAITSAGADNSYGHPAPSTLHLATSLGMAVLRTDTQGSLAVTEHNGRLGAVTQR
ncbi:MAG: ComEC/Rec2 family competence protein [Microlunatus sp.]|nr:ComEC/Rec2 family competence protein [Microlunatus sp.]